MRLGSGAGSASIAEIHGKQDQGDTAEGRDAGEGGRIRQLENQKALATTIGIRKQFCPFLARVRFHTNQGQSRPNEAIVFAFRFFSRSGPHLAEA
jgi:hypothetical protein